MVPEGGWSHGPTGVGVMGWERREDPVSREKGDGEDRASLLENDGDSEGSEWGFGSWTVKVGHVMGSDHKQGQDGSVIIAPSCPAPGSCLALTLAVILVSQAALNLPSLNLGGSSRLEVMGEVRRCTRTPLQTQTGHWSGGRGG